MGTSGDDCISRESEARSRPVRPDAFECWLHPGRGYNERIIYPGRLEQGGLVAREDDDEAMLNLPHPKPKALPDLGAR
jgi:hypothetical protein